MLLGAWEASGRLRPKEGAHMRGAGYRLSCRAGREPLDKYYLKKKLTSPKR